MKTGPEAEEPLFCAHCAAELQPGTGNLYEVRVEALADPYGPVLAPEEATGNLRTRIENLIRQMSALSSQEAMDQVYRRLTFHLCGSCFRDWIDHPAG